MQSEVVPNRERCLIAKLNPRRHLRLGESGRNKFLLKMPIDSVQGQVSINGLLLNRSIALASNRTLMVVVLPPFKLAGVCILNPCRPLSPRKVPTSDLNAVACWVAIRTPLA